MGKKKKKRKKKGKKQKKNEQILGHIHDTVDDLLERLDMLDWTVEINYAPDTNNGRVADISYSIHKEASLFVYDYRPDYLQEDMIHELFHCKIGLLSRGYQEIIDGQQNIIETLLRGYEEKTVDNLVEMMRGYLKE